MAFKMKAGKEGPMKKNFPNSVSPMNKPLVGNQKNLPQHLKEKILASPNKMKEGPMKMKEGAAMKMKEGPMKKYKSDAQRKAVHASKAESGMKMKDPSAMKMVKPGKRETERSGVKREGKPTQKSTVKKPNPSGVRTTSPSGRVRGPKRPTGMLKEKDPSAMKMKKGSAMKKDRPYDPTKPQDRREKKFSDMGKVKGKAPGPSKEMTTPVIGRADDGGAKIKRARAADPSPKKMKKDSAMKMKKMDEGVKKTKKEIRKENRADRKKSRDYKKYSQLNPKNPDRD